MHTSLDRVDSLLICRCLMQEEPAAAAPGAKREGDAIVPGTAPATKRARVQPASVLASDLAGPAIMDVPLVSVRGKGVNVIMTIRPNDHIYVVNDGSAEAMPCIWIALS